MTKQEAIIEMRNGEKLTHRFFEPWEWVTFQDGCILSEDGYAVIPEIFWGCRRDKEWETGWDYFPEY